TNLDLTTANQQPVTRTLSESRIGNSFDTYKSPNPLEHQLFKRPQMLQTCAFWASNRKPQTTNLDLPTTNQQPVTRTLGEARIGVSFDTYKLPDPLEQQLFTRSQMLQTCAFSASRFRRPVPKDLRNNSESVGVGPQTALAPR